MPRSFDMSTDYVVTVDEVLRAFSDEEYWLARLADSGADDATLDSMHRRSVRHDGSVDVITTQVLRSDRLPGVVTQFHRGDLRIRAPGDVAADHRRLATANVTGSILAAPASLTGTAVLEPLWRPAAARLKLQPPSRSRFRWWAAKLENFIGDQLAELLIAEQRFTTSVDRPNGLIAQPRRSAAAIAPLNSSPITLLSTGANSQSRPGILGVDRRCQLTSVPVAASRSSTVPT